MTRDQSAPCRRVSMTGGRLSGPHQPYVRRSGSRHDWPGRESSPEITGPRETGGWGPGHRGRRRRRCGKTQKKTYLLRSCHSGSAAGSEVMLAMAGRARLCNSVQLGGSHRETEDLARRAFFFLFFSTSLRGRSSARRGLGGGDGRRLTSRGAELGGGCGY